MMRIFTIRMLNKYGLPRFSDYHQNPFDFKFILVLLGFVAVAFVPVVTMGENPSLLHAAVVTVFSFSMLAAGFMFGGYNSYAHENWSWLEEQTEHELKLLQDNPATYGDSDLMVTRRDTIETVIIPAILSQSRFSDFNRDHVIQVIRLLELTRLGQKWFDETVEPPDFNDPDRQSYYQYWGQRGARRAYVFNPGTTFVNAVKNSWLSWVPDLTLTGEETITA